MNQTTAQLRQDMYEVSGPMHCNSIMVELPPLVTQIPSAGQPFPVEVHQQLFCQVCKDWAWRNITSNANGRRYLDAAPRCHDQYMYENWATVDFVSTGATVTRNFTCEICHDRKTVEVTSPLDQQMYIAEVSFK